MRERFSWAALTLIAVAAVVAQQPPQPAPPAPLPSQPPSQQDTPPATLARSALSVVVLDPGHGGPDAGARGGSGVLESEVVLSLVRLVRAELERQGLRVVLTRQGNENPTFDERSAIANGQRGAMFVSFHVSSTGPVGTARAYFVAPGATPETKAVAATPAEKAVLIRWDQAQESYAELSRRLAELVQVQLALRFRGSTEVPMTAPVRQLRTVAAPAIAIEISSVSVVNRNQIEQMGPALADAVARAVAVFRPLYEAGAR